MQLLKKCFLAIVFTFVTYSVVNAQTDRWIYIGTANHQKVTVYYDSKGVNKYYENANEETSREIIEVWIKYVYYKPVSEYYNQYLKSQPFTIKEYWELVKFYKETKTMISAVDYQLVSEQGDKYTFDSRPLWIYPKTNRIYPFSIYEKVFDSIK